MTGDTLGNLLRREVHSRNVDPSTFIDYDQALERSGLEQKTFNSQVSAGHITAHESDTGYRFDPFEIDQATGAE